MCVRVCVLMAVLTKSRLGEISPSRFVADGSAIFRAISVKVVIAL